MAGRGLGLAQPKKRRPGEKEAYDQGMGGEYEQGRSDPNADTPNDVEPSADGGRRHGRAKTERPHWKKGDYGYENRHTLDRIDDDIHKLPPPEGPADEEPYWDRSKKATDAKFDEWRKKLKKQGYTDDQIDDIISDAVGLHD